MIKACIITFILLNTAYTSPNQSIEYQREIFAAMQKNTFWAWWKFASYNKKWRKACSVTRKF